SSRSGRRAGRPGRSGATSVPQSSPWASGASRRHRMATVTSVIREDAQLVAQRFGEQLRPLAGSTVLLTGASGFLGSYLLDVLAGLNRGVGWAPGRRHTVG